MQIEKIREAIFGDDRSGQPQTDLFFWDPPKSCCPDSFIFLAYHAQAAELIDGGLPIDSETWFHFVIEGTVSKSGKPVKNFYYKQSLYGQFSKDGDQCVYFTWAPIEDITPELRFGEITRKLESIKKDVAAGNFVRLTIRHHIEDDRRVSPVCTKSWSLFGNQNFAHNFASPKVTGRIIAVNTYLLTNFLGDVDINENEELIPNLIDFYHLPSTDLADEQFHNASSYEREFMRDGDEFAIFRARLHRDSLNEVNHPIHVRPRLFWLTDKTYKVNNRAVDVVDWRKLDQDFYRESDLYLRLSQNGVLENREEITFSEAPLTSVLAKLSAYRPPSSHKEGRPRDPLVEILRRFAWKIVGEARKQSQELQSKYSDLEKALKKEDKQGSLPKSVLAKIQKTEKDEDPASGVTSVDEFVERVAKTWNGIRRRKFRLSLDPSDQSIDSRTISDRLREFHKDEIDRLISTVKRIENLPFIFSLIPPGRLKFLWRFQRYRKWRLARFSKTRKKDIKKILKLLPDIPKPIDQWEKDDVFTKTIEEPEVCWKKLNTSLLMSKIWRLGYLRTNEIDVKNARINRERQRYLVIILDEVRCSSCTALISPNDLLKDKNIIGALLEGSVQYDLDVPSLPDLSKNGFEESLATWDSEVCVFGSERCVIYCQPKTTLHMGSRAGNDRDYWRTIARGIEHVISVKTLLHIIEKWTMKWAKGYPDVHDAMSPPAQQSALVSKARLALRYLPAIREVAVASSAFRATYAVQKFNFLMEKRFQFSKILSHVDQNMRSIETFLLVSTSERRGAITQNLAKYLSTLALLLTLLGTFYVAPSFVNSFSESCVVVKNSDLPDEPAERLRRLNEIFDNLNDATKGHRIVIANNDDIHLDMLACFAQPGNQRYGLFFLAGLLVLAFAGSMLYTMMAVSEGSKKKRAVSFFVPLFIFVLLGGGIY